jgi:hypothetical protein
MATPEAQLSPPNGAGKALAPRAPVAAETRISFETVGGFEAMQRAAALLSASSLVPEVYRGDIANCVIALNMAQRLGADPLMVMQNLYLVHGRPAWSASFLIASVNSCGRFAPLRFRWTGERGQDSWGCIAYTNERGSDAVLEGSEITVGMAKAEGWYGKNGSKWKTMPQQMLMYRSASFWARAYAPELTMGLQTRDEVEDSVDITPSSARTLGVHEQIAAPPRPMPDAAAVPAEQSAEAPKEAQAAAPAEAAPPPPTDPLLDAMLAAKSLKELQEVGKRIRAVTDEAKKEEYRVIYQARATELQKAEVAK